MQSCFYEGTLQDMRVGLDGKVVVSISVRIWRFGGNRQMYMTCIVGLVVEFIVAIDEARVRFADNADLFLLFFKSQSTVARIRTLVHIGTPIA